MTRVQILLPEDQDRRLEELAARKRESKAGLVRKALDLLFRSEAAEPDSLLDLIGQAGRVGRRDVSIKHDEILIAAKRRRRKS